MENLTNLKVELKQLSIFSFSINVANNNMNFMEVGDNLREFILLGLSQNPKMPKVIFFVFLIIDIISMGGNMLTMLTIIVSPL